MFSLVMLKTELFASKEVTPNNLLPSSTKFIGGLDKKNFPSADSLLTQESPGVLFLLVQSTYLYVF